MPRPLIHQQEHQTDRLRCTILLAKKSTLKNDIISKLSQLCTRLFSFFCNEFLLVLLCPGFLHQFSSPQSFRILLLGLCFCTSKGFDEIIPIPSSNYCPRDNGNDRKQINLQNKKRLTMMLLSLWSSQSLSLPFIVVVVTRSGRQW